jgi:tRNA pseudouridine32 synthase / 23S rRNA pseudouridine746 synthase
LKAPLPIVDGVAPSSIWLPRGPWKTVLAFLTEKFPDVPANTWLRRMADGTVVDENGESLNAGSRHREGVCVYYYRELISETSIPFTERVLYEDEQLLIADKPHFLPVVPAGRFLRETLLVRLRRSGKRDGLAPVHRLDRETAGLVLFSVNPKTRGEYTKLFREGRVGKVYHALAPCDDRHAFPITRRSRIVRGEPFFRMKEVEGVANSETCIEVLQSVGENALYRLRPATGKKHQLRLHLAALGIPILNDKLYPEYVRRTDRDDDFSRPLKLFAKSIGFTDPLSGQALSFESSQQLV